MRRAGAWNTPQFLDMFQVAPAPLTHVFSLRSPARCTTSSVQLFLPSLRFATQQQHSLVTATDGAFGCIYVCFCTWSARCLRHTRLSRRGFFGCWKKQPLSLAATNQYTAVQQQQYNGNRAPSACLCASSHGVCACGWCTAAADEPRQQYIINTSNATVAKHT